MRRRWIVYTLVGLAFGALDYFYLGRLHNRVPHGLFAAGPLGESVDLIVRFGVLNVGLWLVPAVPVASAEARRTGSALRSAAATIYVWCVAVMGYYLTNAVHLLLVGEPGRPEMHISHRASEHFAANWAGEFRYTVFQSSAEWLVVAIVGGAIVGLLVGAIALQSHRAPAPAAGP